MNSISLTTFTMMKFNLDIGFPMEFTLVEVSQCIVHWVSHFVERPQTSRQGEGHCCWLSYVLASSSTPPQSPTSSSSPITIIVIVIESSWKVLKSPVCPKNYELRIKLKLKLMQGAPRMSSQGEGHCHSQYWFRVHSAKSTVGFCKKNSSLIFFVKSYIAGNVNCRVFLLSRGSC